MACRRLIASAGLINASAAAAPHAISYLGWSYLQAHACALSAVADSCAVSRKACKNCTCGRAEDEAAGAPPPKLTLDMLENPGSAGGCGSCSLGDAFRCASCPYRGLPSFQPGKKIELPTGFLAADF